MRGLLQAFKNLRDREAFDPTIFLGPLLNPFFFSRRELKKEIEGLSSDFTGRTLDVGCGFKPYRKYFDVTEYIGMEIDISASRYDGSVDVFYSGNEFPFPNHSFDHVLTFQVLEHVRNPSHFISEICRVLKPGGKLLLSVPFVWEEHEAPNDHTRFTSYGLRELLEKNGLQVIRQRKLSCGMTAFAQSITGTLTTTMSGRSRLTRIAFQVFLVAPIHFFTLAFQPLCPKNDRFYLDNLVMARRLP